MCVMVTVGVHKLLAVYWQNKYMTYIGLYTSRSLLRPSLYLSLSNPLFQNTSQIIFKSNFTFVCAPNI